MADTKTIEGVEILRTGTFHGLRGKSSYSRADLDEFVEAHEALTSSGQAAVKVALGGGTARIPVGRATVGHNEHDDAGRIIREAPVIGRLAKMYRKGDRLLADIADVPEKLAGAIMKAYPDRSIEAIRFRVDRGVEIAGRQYRNVITSLALLGESLPAVDGLADLPKILQGKGDAAGLVVAHGAGDDEADVVTCEADLGSRYVQEAVAKALRSLWKVAPNDPRGWPWAEDVYADYAIVKWDGKAWSVPYVESESGVTIGKPYEVRPEWVPVEAMAAGGADGRDPAEVLDELLAALDRWGEAAVAAVSGKVGSPIVRTRIRALKEELRRIVGARIVTNTRETMNRDEILAKLGLATDAGADAVVAALSSGEPAVAETVAALAGGMEFADPAQFVAWLAGKLDVSPGDLAGIAGAVAKALGLDPDAGAGTGAETEGEPTTMGKSKTESGAGGESADVVTLAQLEELRAEHVEALKRLAVLEGESATEKAESLVDGYIAQGKAVPAQRETLVALAKQSPDAVTALLKDAPVVVKLGERGTSEGGEPTEFEPAASEVRALMAMGYEEKAARLSLINLKRADAGMTPVEA